MSDKSSDKEQTGISINLELVGGCIAVLIMASIMFMMVDRIQWVIDYDELILDLKNQTYVDMNSCGKLIWQHNNIWIFPSKVQEELGVALEDAIEYKGC